MLTEIRTYSTLILYNRNALVIALAIALAIALVIAMCVRLYRKVLMELVEILKATSLPKSGDLLEISRRQLHSLQYDIFVAKKLKQKEARNAVKVSSLMEHSTKTFMR